VNGSGSNSKLSDWPVRCAAERMIGNDSYVSGKHYLSGASIFQSSAVNRATGLRFGSLRKHPLSYGMFKRRLLQGLEVLNWGRRLRGRG